IGYSTSRTSAVIIMTPSGMTPWTENAADNMHARNQLEAGLQCGADAGAETREDRRIAPHAEVADHEVEEDGQRHFEVSLRVGHRWPAGRLPCRGHWHFQDGSVHRHINDAE